MSSAGGWACEGDGSLEPQPFKMSDSIKAPATLNVFPKNSLREMLIGASLKSIREEARLKLLLTEAELYSIMFGAMKNGLKKSKTAFTATEVGVLIEELRSQFRAFGEKLSAVSNKVDMTYEELGRQKEEIFIIKADIRVIKAEIEAIKIDLRLVKKDIAEIKEDLGKRLTHLEAIK